MSHEMLESYSNLIGKIYDAVLDASIWPDVLDAIRIWMKAQTTELHCTDALDSGRAWQLEVGYDPKFLQLYFEKKFYMQNPGVHAVARLAAGEADFISADAEIYRKMLESEFYREWLEPQGFIDGAALALVKTPTSASRVALIRHRTQGCFSDADLRRLELLYPHLRRAVLIGRIVDENREQKQTLLGVMDALAAGVFLLTIDREISFVNLSGAAMLEQRGPLKRAGGRLWLMPEESDRALANALRALAVGLDTLGGKGMSLPLDGEEGDAYVAHLLPLDAARRKTLSATEGAVAALFVRRVNHVADAVSDAFASKYGLTPQETRVMRTVIDLGGVPLAAEFLGLSPTTVRTHVSSIFDKTGVRSQAALVRLLVETQSPFVAPQ